MGRVVLVIGLILASSGVWAGVALRSGKITGIVVDAGSGRPVPGALAIAKWETRYVQGRGEKCVRSIVTKTDAAGRFEIPEWTLDSPWGDSASYVVMAYAPNRTHKGNVGLGGARQATRFNDIRIPPADLRIEMADFQGEPAERLAALKAVIAATDCRGGDTRAAQAFYLAVRSELVAMPPEIGNYRPDPESYSPLEMVDKVFLEPSGVRTADLPQVPVVAAPTTPSSPIGALVPGHEGK